ncbi:MAG: EsaB/YukD family protein [Lachnospiraceae bacterium]|nr:EsaB/YukD family protein [Lachnospiraceae bacterium]
MINVDIYIASLDQNMEFRLDEDAKVRTVLSELMNILETLTKTTVEADYASFSLCSQRLELILNQELTLSESGIRNGDHLILV